MVGNRGNTHNTGGETRHELANSYVTLEYGEAGVIAKIERTAPEYSRDYAGPLPNSTVDAIKEVAR